MNNIICNQCKNAIKTASYVKCYQCNSCYHFTTCSPLSESTYSSMTGERKMNWRCHICKPRNRSPNNIYQAFVFDENNQQKQLREDDTVDENEKAKKYKESKSLSMLESKLCSVQSDVTEIKTEFRSDMRDLKSQIEMLASSVNGLNMEIRGEIRTALSTITNTLSTLVAQVNELSEKDRTKEKQISSMDTRINKIEQQMMVKNIEIKNIENKEISALEVVQIIATNRDVVINESDVTRAYRSRKQNNKIFVEFSSLSKKLELMSKIERHRVDASIINSSDDNNSNTRYIYINDQLTFSYRRLLWIAKTKAHEANWKYVWVKNGTIFARKAENSPAIIINNATDIESIFSTI